MQIGMRQIPSETIVWFGTACSSGELSRTALARELCFRENWSGRIGWLCPASVRKLLAYLAGKLGVRLPEADATALYPHARLMLVQRLASHSDPKTAPRLCDRRDERVSLDEVERAGT